MRLFKLEGDAIVTKSEAPQEAFMGAKVLTDGLNFLSFFFT